MSEAELNTIPRDNLPPLTIHAAGESADEREANLQSVIPSPGYPHMLLLLADAITKRTDLILMDFTQQQCSVRYQVDGFWYNMPPLARNVGDFLLASMKQLAGLDFGERRARQVGSFTAEYLRQKHKCRLTTQGVDSGERVALEIDRKKPPTENLGDIGMRERMQKQLIDIMNQQEGGMVLFSALPGDGLSTTWKAALQSTDRFMRDFVVLEESSVVEPEIINVESVTFDKSKGETLDQTMTSILLREPNVICVTELNDGATLNQMVDLANNRELTMISRLHAKHAVEAVLRAIKLNPDREGFARALKAVTGQRVVRMLCTDCRQPYQPNANLLAQLGLPASRVPVLYRPFQVPAEQAVNSEGQPIDIEPCSNCGGPGYFERTGLFELLVVDERFRQAMLDPQPTVQKLAQAAAQSGHISLRDEGILMVAQGSLSLEELQRVLKK